MDNIISGNPPEWAGEQTEITKSREYKTFEEAEKAYLAASQRMLSINEWNAVTHAKHKQYDLLTSDVKLKEGTIEEGDFICIRFAIEKGPSEENVLHVERIVTKLLGRKRSLSITCIPVRLIMTLTTTEHVVYSEVSYTFVVQLTDSVVNAGLYIRNVKPSEKGRSIPDKMLDSLKKIFGLDIPFKKEWTTLIENILKDA